MDVLMSIRPKYADSIYRKEKHFEFRRSIFDIKKVRRVYIYTTSPEMKVTGSFKVERVHEGAPETLWERFHVRSGIGRDEFFKYFEGCEKGFAIEIGEVERFEDPIDPREMMPGFVAPQSFMYLKIGTFSKRRTLMEWDGPAVNQAHE